MRSGNIVSSAAYSTMARRSSDYFVSLGPTRIHQDMDFITRRRHFDSSCARGGVM